MCALPFLTISIISTSKKHGNAFQQTWRMYQVSTACNIVIYMNIVPLSRESMSNKCSDPRRLFLLKCAKIPDALKSVLKANRFTMPHTGRVTMETDVPTGLVFPEVAKQTIGTLMSSEHYVYTGDRM